MERQNLKQLLAGVGLSVLLAGVAAGGCAHSGQASCSGGKSGCGGQKTEGGASGCGGKGGCSGSKK